MYLPFGPAGAITRSRNVNRSLILSDLVLNLASSANWRKTCRFRGKFWIALLMNVGFIDDLVQANRDSILTDYDNFSVKILMKITKLFWFFEKILWLIFLLVLSSFCVALHTAYLSLLLTSVLTWVDLYFTANLSRKSEFNATEDVWMDFRTTFFGEIFVDLSHFWFRDFTISKKLKKIAHSSVNLRRKIVKTIINRILRWQNQNAWQK